MLSRPRRPAFPPSPVAVRGLTWQEPILCCPNDPDDAKKLSEIGTNGIDEVFIGSCMTNIGHYRAAGKMLSQFEGQLGTRLWIAPPTKMDEERCKRPKEELWSRLKIWEEEDVWSRTSGY